MNLDKTAKALKKINRLYELISDIGESTNTERDLLKAYAKDLYNSLCDDAEKIDDEVSKDMKKLKKEEKKLKKEHKAQKQAAKAAEESSEIETETPEKEVTSEPMPATAASSSSDNKKTAAAQSGFSAEMLEIFQVNEVTELSDKLSQSPITDLTKAMGINERIFTVNELFGGNTDEFNNLMTALNGLDSYDEAKAVIMKSVASKYDWDNVAKQKKATQLVKLIQRRFK